MPHATASRPPEIALPIRLAVLVAAVLALALAGAAGAHAATVVVAEGDTLGAVAARHGASVAALARANGIADPDRIRAGRRLTVPGGASSGAGPAAGGYRVRSGDTLAAIAARHGTTARALAALNGIRDSDLILAGSTLRVPGASPAASAGPAGGEGRVADLLHRHAARYGVDPALARAVAWQESRWTQGAVSSAGAIGVMQLMPSTARWFGPTVLGRRIDPRVLEDNIEGGVAYLAWLQRRSGSTRDAIAAYYQGLSALRRHGPYRDTRAYVASVLSYVGRV